MSCDTNEQMSDSELDTRIKEAFEQEHMPAGLKASTMSFIHARAAEAAETTRAVAEKTDTPAASVLSVVDRPAEEASRAIEEAAPVVTTPQLKMVAPARPRKRRGLGWRRMIQLMAACMVVGALAVGGLALASETAQVELAGNASVQLGLNRWGTVVRVDCTDADLVDEVNELGLFGLSYNDALDRLAADAELQEQLAQDGTLVLMAAAASDEQRASVLEECERASVEFAVSTTCPGAGQGHGAGAGAGMGAGSGMGAGAGMGAGNGMGAGSGMGAGAGAGAGMGHGMGGGQGHGAGQGAGHAANHDADEAGE